MSCRSLRGSPEPETRSNAGSPLRWDKASRSSQDARSFRDEPGPLTADVLGCFTVSPTGLAKMRLSKASAGAGRRQSSGRLEQPAPLRPSPTGSDVRLRSRQIKGPLVAIPVAGITVKHPAAPRLVVRTPVQKGLGLALVASPVTGLTVTHPVAALPARLMGLSAACLASPVAGLTVKHPAGA